MLEFDITNKEIPENDMSQSEKYEYNVLLYIISKGEPAAVYEIKEALKMNQPTVRNICKRFKRIDYLTEEDGSRNKLMYGPKWEGLQNICDMNPKMLKEIDVMLDGWFNQPKFIESLEEDFGEVVTKNPDYAKTLVKKMINYYSRVDDELEKMTNAEIDEIAWHTAEENLVLKYPAERKTALEFYRHVKFFRKHIKFVRRANIENEQAWSIIDKMNLP